MSLLKQQVVMGYDRGNVEFVQFASQLDEPGFARTVRLARADWEEMDTPTAITVTIEPGDLLNVYVDGCLIPGVETISAAPEPCPESCFGQSWTGVDASSGPDKVWRCDTCGQIVGARE